MFVFARRSAGYKGGFLLLVFATILFVVGFAAPYWLSGVDTIGSLKIDSHGGLWMFCTTLTDADDGYERSSCASYDGTSEFLALWSHAVRALECMCVVGLFIASLYAIGTNCCRSDHCPDSKALVIWSALSGLLGFTGCMVFVGKFEQREALQWAFYLTTVGSGLCVIAAVVIAVSKKPLEADDEETGNAVTMTTISQGQGQGHVHPGVGGHYAQPQTQSYGNLKSHGSPQSGGNPQSSFSQF